MNFIAFDLETTGTVASMDQIIEIGAVRFENGRPEAIFSTLVYPQRSIPAAASAINGISDEMVRGKPTIDRLLEPLAEFCGEALLVAHNAPFDTQFLLSAIKKHECPAPKGIIIDTLPLARKIYPGLANYKLGTLVKHLKIPTTDFHRAEEDATYCGHLFAEILKRISVNGKAPEISQIVALTGKAEIRFPQIVRQPKQLDFLFS